MSFLVGKLRREIEKSKIWMEKATNWSCQKMAMNGENMAKSSSKILGNSGS